MNAIPFMKWRWLAVALSAAAMLAAVASLSLKQLNWGLDFTGGTLVEVEYSDSADLSAIRATLDQEGTTVQSWSALVRIATSWFACLMAILTIRER